MKKDVKSMHTNLISSMHAVYRRVRRTDLIEQLPEVESQDQAYERWRKKVGDPEIVEQVTTQYQESLELENRNKFKQAKAVYESLLAEHSDFANAACRLGYVLEMMKKWPDSINAFVQASEIDPQFDLPLFMAGIIMKQTGRVNEAEAIYRKVIELNPRFASARNNLGLILVGKKDWEGAREQFRAILEDFPNAQNAKDNLSLAEAKIGRNKTGYIMRMRREASRAPGARPFPSRSLVRWLVLGLVVLVIGFGVVFVATGGIDWLNSFAKKSEPPVAASFDTIGKYAEHARVTIEGYLDLPSQARCDKTCGVFLIDPANPQRAISIYIDVPGYSSTPAPNQMESLLPPYDESDFKVRTTDGLYVGDGDRVRLTGTRCLLTDGDPCIHEITLIESVAAPKSTATMRATATRTPTHVRATATITTTPIQPGCLPGARFVQDVTIPDGTQFNPGESFTKVWRVRSSGCAAWASGTRWVFLSGARIGALDGIDVPDTPLGETTDLSVAMKAPDQPGTYKGYWQMQGPDGKRFGDQAYVMIVVPGAGAAPDTRPTVSFVIVNNTGGTLTLYLNGPAQYNFTLSPGSHTVQAIPGDYSYSGRACGGSFNGSQPRTITDRTTEWTWECK